jgi:hypothetical protein
MATWIDVTWSQKTRARMRKWGVFNELFLETVFGFTIA